MLKQRSWIPNISSHGNIFKFTSKQMCMLFGEIYFLSKLAWIWFSVFLNVPFHLHVCMAFNDVLDLAESAFR